MTIAILPPAGGGQIPSPTLAVIQRLVGDCTRQPSPPSRLFLDNAAAGFVPMKCDGGMTAAGPQSSITFKLLPLAAAHGLLAGDSHKALVVASRADPETLFRFEGFVRLVSLK